MSGAETRGEIPWPAASGRALAHGAGRAWRVFTALLAWGSLVGVSLLWGALVVPATLLLARRWPGAHDFFSDLTRGVLRLYAASLLFVRFRVDGEKRLAGARIVVANHQSWLDPIVLIALEPRLGGPVRRYMDRIPVFGSILRLQGFYAAEVGELASLDELERSAALARERRGGLLFFPEGTRSRTGDVQPFHRGAFRAAFDHDLPIQPVVIEGLDHVLPPGHWVARTAFRYPVRIRYLAPIEPPFGSGIRRDVVRALCERVRADLEEELARLRAERKSA